MITPEGTYIALEREPSESTEGWTSRKSTKFAEGECLYFAWSAEDEAVHAIQDRKGFFINRTTGSHSNISGLALLL